MTYLESKVLEEVGGSVVGSVLVAGTSVDPTSDSGRKVVLVGLGGDGEAVLELGDFGLRGVTKALGKRAAERAVRELRRRCKQRVGLL